jgi:hypothetical protein
MSVDLSKILVIGVSSRALFDLEEEKKMLLRNYNGHLEIGFNL